MNMKPFISDACKKPGAKTKQKKNEFSSSNFFRRYKDRSHVET